MKEAIFAFLIALVIGAVINGFTGAGSPSTANPSPQEQTQGSGGNQAGNPFSDVPETSDANFSADVLQSQTPVLVDFYADWCEPCKQMAPTIGKLATGYKGRVKVVRVDVDKNPTTTANHNVQSIPTFLIFKGGKLVDSYTGTVPEGLLKQAIDKALG